jgi:ssDNA-binding Zn-finger/Zn-ribbon topoisomerase 1
MKPTGRKDRLGLTCAECAHFICLSDQPTTDEFSVPCPSCRGRAWYLKSALRSQSVDWAAQLGDQLRKDQKTPNKTTVLRYVTEKISALTMMIEGVRFLPSARLR